MAFQVDGVDIADVKVDGVSVAEVQVDGVKVWPTSTNTVHVVDQTGNGWGYQQFTGLGSMTPDNIQGEFCEACWGSTNGDSYITLTNGSSVFESLIVERSDNGLSAEFTKSVGNYRAGAFALFSAADANNDVDIIITPT